jgi:hypothetical protein
MPDLTKIDIGVRLNVENKEEVIAEIAQGFQDATRAGNPMPGSTGYTIGGTTGVPAQATPLNNAMAGTTSEMSPLNVATGILLAGVIKEMVDNSKILSTVFGTVAQLLGLLLDLILLPFMPIIAFGLMLLASAIMQFGSLWGGTGGTNQEGSGTGILSGLNPTNSNFKLPDPSTWFSGIDWGKVAGELVGYFVGGMKLNPISMLFGGWLASNIEDPLKSFITSLPSKIGGWLSGIEDGIKSFTTSLPSKIGGWLSGIEDSIKSFFTGIPGAISSALSTAASGIGKALVAALPWPFNTIASLGIQAAQNTQNQQGGSPPASNNVFNISGDIIDAENWFTSMMNKVGLPLGL